ncbi:unnamed protein product [Closterium sp. NIES-54]
MLVINVSYLLIATGVVYLGLLVVGGGSEARTEWDTGNIDAVDQDMFRRAMEQPTQTDLAAVQPKIAFLFLVRGPLPLERVWQRFFQAPLLRLNFDYPPLWLTPVPFPPTLRVHVRVHVRVHLRAQWFALTRAHAAKVVEDSKFYETFVKTNAEVCPSAPMCLSHVPHSHVASSPISPLSLALPSTQTISLAYTRALPALNHSMRVLPVRFLQIPDESYIQTILAMLDRKAVEPRSVLYVHWFTSSSSHPMSYNTSQVTREFILSLQRSRFPPAETVGYLKQSPSRPCTVAGRPTHCFLFARKFDQEAVPAFLALRDIIGF